MGVVTQTINYKGFLKSRGQNVQNTEFLMYKLILGIDTAVYLYLMKKQFQKIWRTLRKAPVKYFDI